MAKKPPRRIEANQDSRAAKATSAARCDSVAGAAASRKQESAAGSQITLVPAGEIGIHDATKPEIELSELSEEDRQLDRQLRLWAARHNAGRAWKLYKKTGTPNHGWDAYRKWRESAPSDLPLSKQLLGFLDDQAALQKNANGQKHAAVQSRVRDAFEHVWHRVQASLDRGVTPELPTLCEGAALKFGLKASYVERRASEWGLAKAAKEYAKDQAPHVAKRKQDRERFERVMTARGYSFRQK
ncbi:MAG: hypothetical protein ACT4QA_19280 [Panacagrimonas sp.]